MEVLPPLEVVSMLRHAASGQELFCIIVSGPDTDEAERIALDWYAGYGREASTPIECDGSIILTSKVDGDLACVLSNMDSAYYDDLIAAGLLSKDAPSCSAFAAACVESYQRNLGGILGFCREVDGYEICGVAGYATACEILLRYLAKQPKAEKETPSNPTYEQQTCKKSTCRNSKKQSKAETELLDLIRWAGRECKLSGGYAAAKDKAKYIQRRLEEIKELTAPKLLQMINAKRESEGQHPLDTLTITKDTCPATYAVWKPDRDRARSRSRKGNTSEIAAIESGLQVRRDREGFLAQATTEDERKRDALSAAVDRILRR